MAAQTLHHFPLLPGEIRDQIWDMSVRPQGNRGVHYFTIFSNFPDPVPEKYRRHIIKETTTEQLEVIGAPLRQDEASTLSWNEGNRSTYAIDGGLWTACRESREAMHRRYDIDSWAELYDKQHMEWREKKSWFRMSPCQDSKHGQMPANFGVDDGKQYFTVLPLYDLIILQPFACGLDFGSFIRNIPFASMRFGFGGVRHIAFEYDPSWTAEEVWQLHREWKGEEKGEKPLSAGRFDFYWALMDFVRGNESYDAQVWLVDRRLRRRSTVLNEKDTEWTSGRFGGFKRQLLTFHGEDGCRYYTMPEKYESQYCCYDDDDDDNATDSIGEFTYALSEVASLLEAEEQGVDVDIDDAPLVRQLGIMVCESDGDEGGR